MVMDMKKIERKSHNNDRFLIIIVVTDLKPG